MSVSGLQIMRAFVDARHTHEIFCSVSATMKDLLQDLVNTDLPKHSPHSLAGSIGWVFDLFFSVPKRRREQPLSTLACSGVFDEAHLRKHLVERDETSRSLVLRLSLLALTVDQFDVVPEVDNPVFGFVLGQHRADVLALKVDKLADSSSGYRGQQRQPLGVSARLLGAMGEPFVKFRDVEGEAFDRALCGSRDADVRICERRAELVIRRLLSKNYSQGAEVVRIDGLL